MDKKSYWEERRGHPRTPGSIPVKLLTDDVEAVTETTNLSRTGVLCRINKYIEPMTKLRINLLLSYKLNGKNVTRKVACGGVVVRTESIPGDEGYQIAIYFNDLHSRDSEHLAEYVQTTLPDGPASV